MEDRVCSFLMQVCVVRTRKSRNSHFNENGRNKPYVELNPTLWNTFRTYVGYSLLTED